MMLLSVWTILVLLALASFLGNIFAEPEICNPIECFAELNAIFQSSLDKNSCQKITKIQHCVELCFLEAISDTLKKGLELIRLEVCEGFDGEKLSNKCVNKHKFLLFSCLYKSLNLEAKNSSVDQEQVFCRRGIEGHFCDRQSLVPCTLHTSYIAEKILDKLFRPMIDDHCKFVSNEVWNLEMKPSVNFVDYEDLAVCLDRNNEAVTSCLQGKWSIKNAVSSSATINKQCKAFDSFTTCIHNMIHKNCQSEEALFTNIEQSLYPRFFPLCFKQKSEFQDDHIQSFSKNKRVQISSSTETTVSDDTVSEVPRKDLLRKENQYPTLSAEIPSPSNNASEVVVVHQHIVISVVEHHHSDGSSVIMSSRILTFFVLVLALKAKNVFMIEIH
ncbi:uncharacterized protein LOC129227343 [Uloborus diversus]|uniref:uncharacterized protein LOC129227343 n=1 Tax=Uloborus diversus TaxID=327109 RepID=UPI00240A3090|nr:uncharacterized protein LOC129227343 [Uloborus diversus]